MAKQVATIINATAKTRSVIEDLQARLTAEERRPALSKTPPEEESVDELDRQLQAYFDQAAPKPANGSRTQVFDELRNRVIDSVVDRILSEWSDRQAGALGREVMDRLVERILNEFRKTGSGEFSGT